MRIKTRYKWAIALGLFLVLISVVAKITYPNYSQESTNLVDRLIESDNVTDMNYRMDFDPIRILYVSCKVDGKYTIQIKEFQVIPFESGTTLYVKIFDESGNKEVFNNELNNKQQIITKQKLYEFVKHFDKKIIQSPNSSRF